MRRLPNINERYNLEFSVCSETILSFVVVSKHNLVGVLFGIGLWEGLLISATYWVILRWEITLSNESFVRNFVRLRNTTLKKEQSCQNVGALKWQKFTTCAAFMISLQRWVDGCSFSAGVRQSACPRKFAPLFKAGAWTWAGAENSKAVLRRCWTNSRKKESNFEEKQNCRFFVWFENNKSRSDDNSAWHLE